MQTTDTFPDLDIKQSEPEAVKPKVGDFWRTRDGRKVELINQIATHEGERLVAVIPGIKGNIWVGVYPLNGQCLNEDLQLIAPWSEYEWPAEPPTYKPFKITNDKARPQYRYQWAYHETAGSYASFDWHTKYLKSDGWRRV